LRPQVAGGYGGRCYLPYAFTERPQQPRAFAVNVLIMRTFVQLWRAEGQYAALRQHIIELTQRVQGHDELLSDILSALEALAPPASTSRPIGFRAR